MAGVKDAQEVVAETVDGKEYDVSCCVDKLTCGYVMITLGDDEVDLRNVCCFGLVDNKKRVPYGELSGVDKNKACGCFYTIGAGALSKGVGNGEFCPGIGCSEQYVDEIVEQLKARQTARGDAGNIRRVEENQMRLEMVERKIDALLEHLHIEVQDMNR